MSQYKKTQRKGREAVNLELRLTHESVVRMDALWASDIKVLNQEDQESGHMKADTLLMDLLYELGFRQTVKAFSELNKWYA